MTHAQTGRAIAAVGAVLGFVAIFLNFVSANGISRSYSDDGTILAFLLILPASAAEQANRKLAS